MTQLPPSPFPATPRGPHWPLDKTVLHFDNPEGSVDLAWRDLAMGVSIWGDKGSGKTSGSGETVLRAVVSALSGLLMLPFKVSDRQQLERIAKKACRSHQLCIVERGGRFRFNPLLYDRDHPREDVRVTAQKKLAPMMEAIFAATLPAAESRQDIFWTGQVARITEYAWIILANSGRTPTFSLMANFVRGCPRSRDEVKRGNWRDTLFGELLNAARINACCDPAKSRLVAEATQYWLDTGPGETDVSRSGALMGFENLASVFSHPVLRELFECDKNTLVPEHIVYDGGLVFIDLPIATYGPVGRVAQCIWRFKTQECVQQRKDPEDDFRPFTTIWADEFQFHIDARLNDVLSTCRENRLVFVSLCQSISALYAVIAGRTPEHAVNATMGNLAVKILHNISDPATAKWASEQLGQTRRWKISGNNNSPTSVIASFHHGPNEGFNAGQEMEPWVRPDQFRVLRTGGPLNDFCVDGYVLLGEKSIRAVGKPFLEVTFIQPGERAALPAFEAPKQPSGWRSWLWGSRV